ncbi:MAG: hypothetical protein WCO42_02000 [bacterium]
MTAPLLDLIDTRLLGFLPDLAKIAVWAVLCSIISMALYRWLSPQKRLAAAKDDANRTRLTLSRYDGPGDGLPPLIRASLLAALRHMGLCLGPALVSSIPVIAIFLWMNAVYGTPARDTLSFGPSWFRAWYVPFSVVMLAASLTIKKVWRIV